MAGTNISEEFGALTIGAMLNLILYGLLAMQCYVYATTYQKDALLSKLFVAFLLLADTVDTGFTIAILYDYLIIHFGDLEYLSSSNLVFRTDPALTGIISCAVQVFFANRIRVLTGSAWSAALICTISVISLCGALGTAIAINWWPMFVDFRHFKVVVVLWLAGAVVADVIVTAILVLYLRRKRAGFPVTDDIIDRIVRLALQTGLLTSVIAVLDLIFYLASSSDVHLLFNFPLSKLYTNSLMSTLNARGGWKVAQSTIEQPDQQVPITLTALRTSDLQRGPRAIQHGAADAAVASYVPPDSQMGVSTSGKYYNDGSVFPSDGGEVRMVTFKSETSVI